MSLALHDPVLRNPVPGHVRLRGTDSAVCSNIVRFFCSARTLGPARVVAKLLRRGTASARPGGNPAPAAVNLAALNRCSWIDSLPGARLTDLHVSWEALQQFDQQVHYPRFYYPGDRRVRYMLWHCVGQELCGLRSGDVVVDVGAQAGLWGAMARRRFGCTVYDVDLEYPRGKRGFRIGAPAASIPLPDSSATHVVSFCAFNCFEGDADTRFIREAGRLLRPGGKLVIVPLCIGDQFLIFYDPQLVPSVEHLDPGALPVARPGWGSRFGRWYDREAFLDRIISAACAFDPHVVRVHGAPGTNGQAMYAACFVRKSLDPVAASPPPHPSSTS